MFKPGGSEGMVVGIEPRSAVRSVSASMAEGRKRQTVMRQAVLRYSTRRQAKAVGKAGRSAANEVNVRPTPPRTCREQWQAGGRQTGEVEERGES